ncbi:hypothetical protein [Actinoplanes sp. L3-i22]|uniref:hypothetical protein n=1 Tax=Actinoplanes sp. L3-i22 TaxID=2836373 RepID=UPI001C78392B|nr:hypothetical protein [Actinoplanes sp. L3-i22]BCY06207.1 hypothetical protein L3i22_012950 [Actinoplanes sp. L3-i22]
MIRRTVLPTALFLLLVAGCANSQDTGSTSAGSAPSAAVSPSALPEATSSSALPGVTKPGKPAAGSSTTITGTIASGVEPNCVLLNEPAGGTHLLVFADPALRSAATPGSKVQVTGVPQPGMMSTCQQGEPFLVSSVTPG